MLFFPIHISHVIIYLCILYISYHILHFPSEQPHCQWIIAWDISYKNVYPVQFMLQVLPRWKYQGGWNKISLRFLLSSRLLARHSLEESSHLRQLELKVESLIKNLFFSLFLREVKWGRNPATIWENWRLPEIYFQHLRESDEFCKFVKGGVIFTPKKYFLGYLENL